MSGQPINEGRDRRRARAAGPSSLPGAEGAPTALLASLDAHPALRWALTGLGDTLLFEGILPAAERELLILRVAAGRSPYIAAGHRSIAMRAGLTEAEVAAASGTSTTALKPRMLSLLRAVDELMETGALRSETRSELAGGHDPRELLEVVTIVGFYAIVASITRVYGLEPEPRRAGVRHERRSAAPRRDR